MSDVHYISYKMTLSSDGRVTVETDSCKHFTQKPLIFANVKVFDLPLNGTLVSSCNFEELFQVTNLVLLRAFMEYMNGVAPATDFFEININDVGKLNLTVSSEIPHAKH
jgi:hypothetical protein